MLYTSMDQQPNLINGDSLLLPKISGLGLNFISNAQLRWDPNSRYLIEASLGEIEDLSGLVEARYVSPNKLCFSCSNINDEPLTIRLYPASKDALLPAIAVSKNYQNKIYEIAYASSINKLYLRLKTVYIEYGEDYNNTIIFRRLSNDELFINLDKGTSRVEIKIKRPKTDLGENFILPDEENLLKELASLENVFDPERIWSLFKRNIQIKTVGASFQMEFFKILNDKRSTEPRRKFFGGVNITGGEKTTYFSMAEKHDCQEAESERRIRALYNKDEETV